jgi:hypothetical protein
MNDFKGEQFWSPSGYFIVVRPHVGGTGGWIVRVLNFATWKHRERQFLTESDARKYADLWRI